MQYITLSQQPKSKNLIIYPSGDLSGCTNLSISGCTQHYLCVNNTDEDSFVYNSSTTEYYDLYTHSAVSLSGTINYVQVVAYGRATSAPSIDDKFYLLISPSSNCSVYYSSSTLSLGNGYSKYIYTWVKNPLTNSDWTLSDINSLAFGVKLSCYPASHLKTMTLRPAGDRDPSPYVKAAATGCPVNSHYKCVNEVVSDDAGSYVYNDYDNNHNFVEAEFFEVNLPPEPDNFVKYTKFTLFARGRYGQWQAGFGQDMYHNSVINTGYHGNWTWLSGEKYLTSSEATHWDYIEDWVIWLGLAYLEENDTAAQVTTTYVIVEYETTGEDKKLQISQEYLKVNYTPEISVCSLPAPEVIDRVNSRNVKMLNFWSGDREVYDESRNYKGMVLTGKLWGNDATDTIKCIRQMGLDGSNVTVSGFSCSLFDGTYKIKSFGWQKISEHPLAFNWILELEDVN